MFLTGNEAVGLGVIRAGCKFYAAYPMTPATGVLHFMAANERDYEMIVFQAESEIAAINMVTGASTANVAIILVDARNGVLEQTIRHGYIASLLRIPHVIVCVNKMDLMEYSEEVFSGIQSQFKELSVKLDIQDLRFIPISALKGDNVVDRSTNMDWYDGPTRRLQHCLFA